MLDEGRQLLAACRADRSAWGAVAYLEGEDATGDEHDLHEVTRHQVLVALQYDRRAEDHDLIVYLLEQEITMHVESEYQGLWSSLRLAAFLLATYREVENIWLFVEAKQANFDTECGFDREFLVSAGAERTLEAVRASIHPKRDAALEYLAPEGTALIDEDHLSHWWEEIRREFPEAEADESVWTLIDRAQEFGQPDEAQRLLEGWASEQSHDTRTLGLLRFYWGSFGEYNRAIEVQTRLLDEFSETHWDMVSNLRDLADLYRRAGRYDEAWHALVKCDPHLSAWDAWKKTGLGRSLVEAALDVARRAGADHPAGRAAFQWADTLLLNGCSSSPLILSKAIHAADTVGDGEAAERYRTRAQAEGVDENLALELD